MTMNSPTTAGRGLRRWGGGLFWFGVLALIGSAILLFAGVRNINFDDVEFTSQGTATFETEQFMVVDGSSANDCVVTSPSGQEIPPGPDSGQVQDYFFVTVIPVESGQHTITCVEGAQYAFIDESTFASAGGGLLAVGGSILGFLFGGFLILLGAILWFVGRSKRKSAIMNEQQYGGGQYGGGQHGGGQYDNGPYDNDPYNNGQNQGGPYNSPPPPPGYSQ